MPQIDNIAFEEDAPDTASDHMPIVTMSVSRSQVRETVKGVLAEPTVVWNPLEDAAPAVTRSERAQRAEEIRKLREKGVYFPPHVKCWSGLGPDGQTTLYYTSVNGTIVYMGPHSAHKRPLSRANGFYPSPAHCGCGLCIATGVFFKYDVAVARADAERKHDALLTRLKREATRLKREAGQNRAADSWTSFLESGQVRALEIAKEEMDTAIARSKQFAFDVSKPLRRAFDARAAMMQTKTEQEEFNAAWNTLIQLGIVA